LVLGGKADWRLPNIYELETIIDYSRALPSIDPVFSCRWYSYWSSSTYVYYADYPDYAFHVNFWPGDVFAYYKPDVGYVRCVRGGP